MSPYTHHHNIYHLNQEEIVLLLYTKKDAFANSRNNIVRKKNIYHKINTLTERNLIDF